MAVNADYQNNNGFGSIVAGMALAALDPIEIDSAGKAWKAQVTDYAAVSPVGTLVAETAIVTGGRTQAAYSRLGLDKETVRGDFYTVTPNNIGLGNDGLTVQRFSSAGALLRSAAIDSTASQDNDAQVLVLSNGNVAATWKDGSNNLKFTIYDAYLGTVVKAVTTIEAIDSTAFHSACVLSGGGFAVSYLKNATATERLAILDNSGNAVGGTPITWQTWTGTAGPVSPSIAQLSNGNIVLGAASAYTTTIGLYFAIYSAAGVQQVAPALVVNTAPTNGQIPSISVLPGFFAIGYRTSAPAIKFAVYSNAGAIQGAVTTQATTSSESFSFDWANDTATQFFLSFVDASGWWSVTVQTSGSAAAAVLMTATAAGNNATLSTFYEHGRLVIGACPTRGAGVQQRFGVFNPANNMLEKDLTVYGTAPTLSTGFQKIIPGGDFSLISRYAFDSEDAFMILKHTASAFVGQAINAVAAGAAVFYRGGHPVAGGGNIFRTNAMIGSPSKTFDHSAATPHGNKGTLMANSVSLQGM